MSGGSFEYLYLKDTLPGYLLEQMAAELDALGAREAAANTRRYIAPVQDDPIRSVWHAVEWWRSSDWGEDQVREALERYAQATATEPATRPGDNPENPRWHRGSRA